MNTGGKKYVWLLHTFIWTIVNFHLAYPAYSPEMETEIRNETVLSGTYDPVSRPHAETHIKAGLTVLAIDDLDLKGQRLTMAGWLTFEWDDHRIVWNKSAKGDVEYIFTKPKFIWKPEVVIDNALQDLDIISNAALFLRLKYDGTVDWEPPMLFVTHCQVDITFYPYDEQRCAVEIVSWTYTIEEVKFDHLYEHVNLEDFEIHGEWEILYTEIEDKNLTEHLPDGTVRTFPQLDFWIYLRRRTQFYNLNVMMPIVLTSLMVVMVFIVPVDSGEKVSYVLTVFLSLAVLLTIVADSLPPTSITVSVLVNPVDKGHTREDQNGDNWPLLAIGLYLGIVLILTAFGILLTVCILIIFHKEGKPAENSCIVSIAISASKIICFESPAFNLSTKNKVSPMKADDDDMETSSVVSEDFVVDAKDGSKDIKKAYDDVVSDMYKSDIGDRVTWKAIALILDRFCFFFFLIITVVMNFSFVIALALGGRANGHH